MPDFDNTNSGALFKNEDKTSEKPNWPDYNGSIDADGKQYWLRAWIKKSSKSGKTYMSLSLEPKDEAQKPTPAQNTGSTDSFDDPPPF